MAARLLVDRSDVRVYHAAWTELLDALPQRDDGTVCDLLCVDAPYSERTHAGHDGGTRYDGSVAPIESPAHGSRKRTRGISYAPWSPEDVEAFVAAWSPLTRGWLVTITDHVLAPAWAASLERAGRLAFAPIPIIEIGSRVRLIGDGPSSWTCYLVVARPRNASWLAEWRGRRKELGAPRALPGAYVYTGHGDRLVMGGKRTDCMEAIVRDYSLPGELVCDPCCGAGTALDAALRTGRIAVGGDAMLEHAQLAASRLDRMVQRPLFAEAGGAYRSLFDEAAE